MVAKIVSAVAVALTCTYMSHIKWTGPHHIVIYNNMVIENIIKSLSYTHYGQTLVPYYYMVDILNIIHAIYHLHIIIHIY